MNSSDFWTKNACLDICGDGQFESVSGKFITNLVRFIWMAYNGCARARCEQLVDVFFANRYHIFDGHTVHLTDIRLIQIGNTFGASEANRIEVLRHNRVDTLLACDQFRDQRTSG